MLSFLDEDETVTYTVTAPAVSGAGSFTGVLKDEDQGEHAVGGEPSVTVVTVVDVLAAYDTDGRTALKDWIPSGRGGLHAGMLSIGPLTMRSWNSICVARAIQQPRTHRVA